MFVNIKKNENFFLFTNRYIFQAQTSYSQLLIFLVFSHTLLLNSQRNYIVESEQVVVSNEEQKYIIYQNTLFTKKLLKAQRKKSMDDTFGFRDSKKRLKKKKMNS
jgi:hypothetical protein